MARRVAVGAYNSLRDDDAPPLPLLIGGSTVGGAGDGDGETVLTGLRIGARVAGGGWEYVLL
jgi:hypothetical protein